MVWKLEKRDGKWTKPPYQLSGRFAKSDNPRTWTSYAAVHGAASSGQWNGIGYVFSADDPYTGVDLDGCRNPATGAIAEWAQVIIDSLASYTEVSPSGEGVKVFVRGSLPVPGGKKALPNAPRIGAKDPAIEAYSVRRYFTVTSQHLAGTPETIEDRAAALSAFYEQFFGSTTSPPARPQRPATEPNNVDDRGLLEVAFRAQNGNAVRALWNGDTSAYGGDDSAADLALCSHLAFYTGGDEGRVDRLFRQSSLYRDKWDRDDYRKRTIDKALELTTESYKPRRPAVTSNGHRMGPSTGEVIEDYQTSSEPPRPLRRPLPDPEPFPIEALGAVLGAAAQAIEQRIQAPTAVCAQSVLAAATLAVQAHANVVLPYGQTRPIVGYFITVAESGERKTATDDEALWPIRTLEEELLEQHADQRQAHANAREAWESERRRILGDKQLSVSERRGALDDLGPAPAQPLEPLLTCPEPTLEGLTKLFASGRPSLGLFSNEGGQFVGGYGMSPDHRLKTAATLSSLWDGGVLRRVRAGDGTLILPGRRLAAHLMVQPQVSAQLLADPLLNDQGLLSRLLCAAPASTAGTRLWREPAESAGAALKRYGGRLLGILRAPLPLREGTTNELRPRRLVLTPSARKLWISFADHIERQLGPGGSLEAVRPFASKAAEHAARLGAVPALVDDLNVAELGEQYLAAGIALVQFYISEWLRLQDAGWARPELLRAERLLKWLRDEWPEAIVGLPEVYQGGPSQLRDAKSAREAMAVLEEHGWVARIAEGAQVGAVFRREAWQIVREEH